MSTFVRLLASGVLLLSAAAPAAGAAPALSGAPAAATPAGTAGYCPGETGVTVVVDFTDLGGDVVVRCSPGETGTGLDALTGAGFTFEGTQRWGTAFICRLQGRPTADEELPVKGSRTTRSSASTRRPPRRAGRTRTPRTAATGPTARPAPRPTGRSRAGSRAGGSRSTAVAPSRRWRRCDPARTPPSRGAGDARRAEAPATAPRPPQRPPPPEPTDEPTEQPTRSPSSHRAAHATPQTNPPPSRGAAVVQARTSRTARQAGREKVRPDRPDAGAKASPRELGATTEGRP
jgi:hypothetical protein